MQASVYYVAGWHVQAALKASKKRKGKMKHILQRLAENGTATLEEVWDLPISKVLKSDQYGGLCYVSNAYFQIIIRLEYIFVKLLTISKLCVLGKDLIKTVYQCIHENDLFSDSVVRILDNNTFDSDVIDTLLKYLARTYCRMRGKDFCQALMQKDFNNLGQGIRNVTAAIAEINKDKVKKWKQGNSEGVDSRKSPKNSEPTIARSRSDSTFSITKSLENVNIVNSGKTSDTSIEEHNILELISEYVSEDIGDRDETEDGEDEENLYEISNRDNNE